MEMRALEDIEDIGEDLTHRIPPIAFSLSESFLHSHCSSCFHPLNNPNKFPPLHTNNNNPIDPNSIPSIFYCSQICSSLDSHTHFFSGEFHLFSIIQSQPNILNTTTTTDIRTALRLLFFFEKFGFLSTKGRICGLLSNIEKFENEDDDDEILGRIKEGGRLMAMARRIRDGGVSGVYELKENNLVEEIVLGQILMNSVEVQGDEECYLGNAIYGPIFSWINHSCSPNGCYQFLLSGSELVKEFDDSKLQIEAAGDETVLETWVCDEGKFNNGICGYGPRMVVRSTKPIKKGEEVCITYTDLLQPTAIRRSELWSKYHFYCCCLRCSSSPPTYIDNLLQESASDHLKESKTFSKEAYEELADHMDDIISEYLSVGNPKSCCEKLEDILKGFQEEEPSQQNFKLHPLYHLSINAYIALASAYKIRANSLLALHSGIGDHVSEAFELSKNSAAYYILLAGVTHHLFLFESSLIPVAAHFWINAGESLLNLVRSLTPKTAGLNFSSKIRDKCMLMDRLGYDLGSDISRSKPRRLEFIDITSSFLACVSNIMPTVWHFLIDTHHHCYFKYIKDPMDFSLLGIISSTKLIESQTLLGNTDSSCVHRRCSVFEDTAGGVDKQTSNVAQLGIHCLLYGEFLASICYSSDCYLNKYVRNLLFDNRWI
ncbi:hypothetical protein MKW92_003002 [Papaver armeniacum]|nr:hypothetical protein MKW92_003002 [Papaver armeniacum]